MPQERCSAEASVRLSLLAPGSSILPVASSSSLPDELDPAVYFDSSHTVTLRRHEHKQNEQQNKKSNNLEKNGNTLVGHLL